jgi:excisionase family DNA binding protein
MPTPDAPTEKKSPQLAKVFYTRQEFAFVSSISLSTLERLIATGAVKTVRFGRAVRVPSDQLARLAKRPVVATHHHGAHHHAVA